MMDQGSTRWYNDYYNKYATKLYIETVEEVKIRLRAIDWCISVSFRLEPTLAQFS